MKAVVYDKSNKPDVLSYREVEKPAPGDDQVLVKIQAVSVNAADYRSMRLGLIPKRKIFGADIAGQVEAVGKDVKEFKAGDMVFGELSDFGFGGFAEYVAVPERAVVPIPQEVSPEQAAAIPISAITALQGLRDKGGIRQGHQVLICGAGGGVGTFAVQLAKYFGAEVTAVCSSNNEKLIRSLGADHVIDYQKARFADSPALYDIVLAINGNYRLSDYMRVLKPKGICVVIGGAFGQIIKTLLFQPFISLGGKKLQMLAAKTYRKDLDYLMKLTAKGEIKPVIDRTYPLEKTAEAVSYLSEGHARGKVVIQVSHES